MNIVLAARSIELTHWSLDIHHQPIDWQFIIIFHLTSESM